MYPPLQQGPERLHAVRVCHTPDVLSDAVPDALVVVIQQSKVRPMFVGVEDGPRRDVCPDEVVNLGGRGVRQHLGLDPSGSRPCAGYR